MFVVSQGLPYNKPVRKFPVAINSLASAGFHPLSWSLSTPPGSWAGPRKLGQTEENDKPGFPIPEGPQVPGTKLISGIYRDAGRIIIRLFQIMGNSKQSRSPGHVITKSLFKLTSDSCGNILYSVVYLLPVFMYSLNSCTRMINF